MRLDGVIPVENADPASTQLAVIGKDMQLHAINVGKFVGQIAASKEVVAAMQGEIAKKQDETTQNSVNKQIDARLGELGKGLADGTKSGEQQITQMALQIAELQKDIKENAQAAAEKDKNIADMQRQISDLSGTVADLENQINAVSDKIPKPPVK